MRITIIVLALGAAAAWGGSPMVYLSQSGGCHCWLVQQCEAQPPQGHCWASQQWHPAATWQIACEGPPAAAEGPSTGASTKPARPELAFDPAGDFADWQERLHGRLMELLDLPAEWDHAIRWSAKPDSRTDQYTMERVEFTAEPGQTVPGYLLKPIGAKRPLPVMICLQGHSPGMHISIGRGKTKREIESIRGGRDIALQAVRHGWAALAIEQRAFGCRAEKGAACQDVALRMIMRGESLTGRRVFDVRRAVDFIATQPDLDATRIACMGNSSGGTVSFFAACADRRIRLAVVSCSFCTYADSWLAVRHCACGYVPGIMKVADMPDLAGLIAPRNLIIVAGKKDGLARFSGVEEGYRLARRAFTASGHPDRILLLAAEGGHQFYPDLAWPKISAVLDEWK